MIEAYIEEAFVWMSYVASDVAGVIPWLTYNHSVLCINKRGKDAKNWALEHQQWIVSSNARMDKRPRLESCMGDFMLSVHYQCWYIENRLPYLFGG
ncbi:hypothetical protein J1N35_034961 [Gossypium stocksii]|uniref:Uncharacterized protein n=1 Tax=Gossypium stocksii TaxID=47602 RepID=A0A9D3UT13_9ROSI|nr:hypothetical protein J1N35_034961 [Gossypium stocksii]